jgi:hypothetical protein
MQTVLTAFWKGGDVPGYEADTFTWHHVNKLAEGVARSFKNPTRLLVMRDQWMAEKADERHSIIWEINLPSTHSGGWTPWLELFWPELISLGERFVYVGLDTIFVRDCDWLFDWHEADVGLIPDPFHSEHAATCIVTANAAGASLIQQRYRAEQAEGFNRYQTKGHPSDWRMLRQMQKDHGWALLDDPRILSYKQHVRKNGNAVSPEASIVYCHGRPRPWEIPEGDEARRIWEG